MTKILHSIVYFVPELQVCVFISFYPCQISHFISILPGTLVSGRKATEPPLDCSNDCLRQLRRVEELFYDRTTYKFVDLGESRSNGPVACSQQVHMQSISPLVFYMNTPSIPQLCPCT